MIHVWKVEGDRLELNKEQLLQYKALSDIYGRDTSKGKEFALMELRYINFRADKNGYCLNNGLSDKEAHEYAVLLVTFLTLLVTKFNFI